MARRDCATHGRTILLALALTTTPPARAAAPATGQTALDRAAAEAAGIDDSAGVTTAAAEAAAPSVRRRPAIAPSLAGAAIPITVIVQEGDTPTGGGGNPVTSVNSPFTNGDGEVGFTGVLDNGGSSDAFVWFDTGILWRNSSAVGVTLAGGESTMGVGNNGEFVYSPSVDGDDAVWSDDGELAVDSDPAPGFPVGTTTTFHSRPQMLPGGQAYWVSGFNESGGTTTQGRMLYTSSDGTPGTISVVLRSDDMVCGGPIDRPSGVGFDYQLSDNGAHHIHALLLDTGATTNDDRVYVDGACPAAEAAPTGQGDNWDNFDSVAINDSGNYLFSGDTDGATTSDEFIAYNGTISLREGDVIGGVTLTSGSTVQTLSLDNLGRAVHVWLISGGNETLFFTPDASDLAASIPLLRVGDSVDVDGNGSGDATVTDFNASTVIGPGLWLAETDRVFVEVDLDYGAGDLEAIIAVGLPAPLVINEVDYAQTGTDGEEFIEIFNPTADPVNLDAYALELVDGTGGGAAVYQTIELGNVVLAAGDFYVVCADMANVPFCDLDVIPDTDLIQDGAPDAVALTFAGTVIDTVSYDGDSGAPYTEGSGTGLVDDPANAFFSISRTTDGADTGANNVDFAGRCNSPGLANLATTTSCQMVPVTLLGFDVE